MMDDAPPPATGLEYLLKSMRRWLSEEQLWYDVLKNVLSAGLIAALAYVWAIGAGYITPGRRQIAWYVALGVTGLVIWVLGPVRGARRELRAGDRRAAVVLLIAPFVGAAAAVAILLLARFLK